MEYTILILLLPLASFLVLGLAGMKMRPAAAGAVGTAVLAVVALLSYWTAFEYFSAGRDVAGVFPTLIPWNAVWLPIGGALHIDLGILLDPISVMMLVVISTVSLMVHIYSLGYMKGERGFQRYYAFLSLFTMSMIGLVVATNIFQMYLFWELVGVSSYLLIGFYYTKKEAVAASKKAFIVTRFADLGFLIGILVYGYYAGTFSFTPEAHALAAAGTMIPLALGLMFIGGAGKSAMFPLHIWLPDAMEGPTPVSALIHAATMVVAPRPPVASPTIASATSIRRLAMPERSIREPQSMKKGIASREVLSDAVIVVCASMVSIWLPVTALSEKPAAMVAIPSETAMGTVRRRQIARTPKRTPTTITDLPPSSWIFSCCAYRVPPAGWGP